MHAQTEQLTACVFFLGRLIGVQVPADKLRASLAGLGGDGRQLSLETVLALLRQAGMLGVALALNRPRQAAELPALLLGPEGHAAVVMALKDGRYECHLPDIEGSCWLTAAELELEVPWALWIGVRQTQRPDPRGLPNALPDSLANALPRTGDWFWSSFKHQRWIFGWALVGTLALNVFGLLMPFYSMAVYDRVILNNAMGSLGVLTIGAAILIGFELVMRLLRSHLLEAAAQRMDVALSAQVYAQCLRLRAADRPASGAVLANTVRDFEFVREFFATRTLTVLGDLPFMILYLAAIALVGGGLVLVPLVALLILLGVAWASRAPLARKVQTSMQARSQRNAQLFEAMNGLDTLKALGAEAWGRRLWESLTQKIAHNSLETRAITAKVASINMAVLALVGVSVVAIGAMMVNEQAMTLGQLIAVSMLTARALTPISQIASLMVGWQQSKTSYRALDQIMTAPTDESSASLQAPPLRGAIECRDLAFAYPKGPPVIERLNLKIKPGERVAIIGKVGSGKSMLLKLLINQYAPASGSVRVDDHLTTLLQPLSLRRQIGYVPQDVILFHGTLRENIELGRVQAGNEALLRALRTAGLDEVVSQLPEGVDTQLGERGERLSGGQRQIVAIARALLLQPKLLLLDEPSSMIDPTAEQALMQRLRALKDTTIIVVTHRMAMLALVDRVVVMDGGCVVRDGPRDEVLKALAPRPAQERGAPLQQEPRPNPVPSAARFTARPAA